MNVDELRCLVQNYGPSFLQRCCFEYEQYTDCSALMVASLRGLYDEAKCILDENTSQTKHVLDLQDNSGYSALMFACLKGNEKVANLLLDRGADIDQQSLEWESAYSLAMQHSADLFSLLEKRIDDVRISMHMYN